MTKLHRASAGSRRNDFTIIDHPSVVLQFQLSVVALQEQGGSAGGPGRLHRQEVVFGHQQLETVHHDHVGRAGPGGLDELLHPGDPAGAPDLKLHLADGVEILLGQIPVKPIPEPGREGAALDSKPA